MINMDGEVVRLLIPRFTNSLWVLLMAWLTALTTGLTPSKCWASYSSTPILWTTQTPLGGGSPRHTYR